jgi:hypothetical protein
MGENLAFCAYNGDLAIPLELKNDRLICGLVY